MAKSKQQPDETQTTSEEEPPVLEGGPEGSNPGPQLERVTLGDQEYEVDPAVAAVLRQQAEKPTAPQIDYDELATRVAQRLPQGGAQASGQPAQPQPSQLPAEEEIDYDSLMFESPKKALEHFGARIKKQVSDELTQQYTAAQTEQQMWGQFYEQNEDLKDHRILVDAVLRQNWSKLGTKPATDALGELADLTRNELLRIRGDDAKASKGSRAYSEPPNRASSRELAGGEPEAPSSSTLSDFLRKRSQRRFAARTRKQG